MLQAEVKELDQEARGFLRKHGIRFGQFTIFMPAVLKTRTDPGFAWSSGRWPMAQTNSPKARPPDWSRYRPSRALQRTYT